MNAYSDCRQLNLATCRGVVGGGVQGSASPSGFVASGEKISGTRGRVSGYQSRSAHFREERNDESLEVYLVACSMYQLRYSTSNCGF
jgi:hypothetical protein